MHSVPVCFSAHVWSIVLCLQYEPELFPGLIYRMKVPKIVLLIFVSGKVVLTGRLRCLAAHICCQDKLHLQIHVRLQTCYHKSLFKLC